MQQRTVRIFCGTDAAQNFLGEFEQNSTKKEHAPKYHT